MKKLFKDILWAGVLGVISCIIKAMIGAIFFIPLCGIVNENTNLYIKEMGYWEAVVFLIGVSAFIDLFLKPEKPNKE